MLFVIIAYSHQYHVRDVEAPEAKEVTKAPYELSVDAPYKVEHGGQIDDLQCASLFS
jgi:hypothetical protein